MHGDAPTLGFSFPVHPLGPQRRLHRHRLYLRRHRDDYARVALALERLANGRPNRDIGTWTDFHDRRRPTLPLPTPDTVYRQQCNLVP